MTLKTYLDTIENANKLAQRAGIAPSIIYRALRGADINLSTAIKLVEASDYRIDFTALAVEQDPCEDTSSAVPAARP